jgi:gliding motility-associated-like protein
MKVLKHKFFLLFFILCTQFVFSQVVPQINISNFTANNCRAKFYDDGGPLSLYQALGAGSGGSYTFNIVTGNPVITLTFDPSPGATQIIIGDNITFYKQYPLIPANIISGPYTNVPITGTISPVVSTTGSLIVVWNENGNTQGFGWDAGWSSSASPPVAPTLTVNPVPTCSANSVILNITNPVICDSLNSSYFFVTGPMFPGVASVSPVPSCSNGTTNAVQLFFTNPLSKNCTYVINSTLFRKDKCDSVYKFPGIVSSFSIANCPVQASINAAPINTVCAYSCNTTLTAVCAETVCLNFTYAWNPVLPPTKGPHVVCPTVTTVYTCTMTEQSMGGQTIITKTVYVIDPQIAPPPTPTMCQSYPAFNFTGTPAGGFWTGLGITNSLTGAFCPSCIGPGATTVQYQVGTCTAITQVTIVGIDAGADDAACLGGSSFTVSGGTPTAGIWYGDPDITSGGVFTPSVLGTHTVYYTVGTCTSFPKQIIVTNAITVPTVVINICQSQWYTDFSSGYGILPFGGRYSMVGPGITNNVLGTLSPSLTTPGLHVITYSLASGCFSTFTVNVLDMLVLPTSATTCPSKAPFIPTSTLSPVSGTWTSPTTGAITNPGTGNYNPSAGGITTHTDFLIYAASNGCQDTITMNAIVTTIVQDSLFFCDNSGSFQLTNNIANLNYFPPSGTYTGTGVSLVGPDYFFNTATAGPGVHTVYYDNNTCRDSIKMIVYPSSLSIADRTVCNTHPTFLTSTLVPIGATWSGNGVTNTSTGAFTPSTVLPGTYTVVCNPKPWLGCITQAQITVYQFVAADVGSLSTTYCWKNFTYSLNIVPANGTLAAPPSINNGTFNPSVTGSGTFDVVYSFGTGLCFTKDSVHVKVHPKLTTNYSISKDSICPGQSSILSVTVNGGSPSVITHTYNWSHGLISISKHVVSPASTTIYTVVSTDACSDPATNTMQVSVKPNFYLSYSTTPIQCFGTNGQASLNVAPFGSYSYSWNTSPVQTTTLLTGLAGRSYDIHVRDKISGCTKDTTVRILGYPSIKSLFSPNPFEPCIPLKNKNVTFIDLSQGATTGTWSVDGATQTYTTGESISYDFPKPGTYTAGLTVLNAGNCSDYYSLDICIQESTDIFIPDIFSPNDDGNNDQLFVRGGIKEMTFSIYDRWGDKVFETNDHKTGWDGIYKGKKAEPGVYAYFIDAVLVDDSKYTKKGEVTLVR